ncbi:integrase [Micromonospora sp. NPDC048930]|uniref:integrase n=1 Tax=Micromonospora sp. NPDC048930 TaxID=3364261 RepID=UPI00372374CC
MRTRLRRLHVDGRAYTWRAVITAATGPDGHYHRIVRVRVWGAGKNGCALQADLVERYDGPETYPYPGAEDLRALIRYGLRAGWAAGAVGGAVVLREGSGPVLPRFAVTDLLLRSA